MINSVRAAVILLIFFSVNLFADGGGGGGGGSSTASYAVSLPESIPKLVDDALYDEAIDALNTYISEESRNADAWIIHHDRFVSFGLLILSFVRRS